MTLIAENDLIDFDSLKRMLPQAVDFAAKNVQAGLTCLSCFWTSTFPRGWRMAFNVGIDR